MTWDGRPGEWYVYRPRMAVSATRHRDRRIIGEDPVKVAVLGVGYWGPNLVRNLHAVDACEQVIAHDIDEARLKGILRAFPQTVVASSLDDILRDPGVAAVAIATPVVTHARLATMALEAGKSVLVEKPLAASSEEAR